MVGFNFNGERHFLGVDSRLIVGFLFFRLAFFFQLRVWLVGR